MEGTKDRMGINQQLKFLKDRTWNYFVEKACGKYHIINDTGAPSVYGELVICSTGLDLAFEQAGTDSPETIGIVAEPDVADGELCWIIYSGIAQVLLEDATASTHGYWARSSITQAGRADITNAVPPGHGIGNADIHFHEIGHGLQTVGAGTDVLSIVTLHFN